MSSYFQSSSKSKNTSQSVNKNNTTLIFKTIGRNVQPSFANRLIKQVNDLSYDVQINHIGKDNSRSTNMQIKRKLRQRILKQRKISPSFRQKRKQFFSQQLKRISNTSNFFNKKQQQKYLKNKSLNLSSLSHQNTNYINNPQHKQQQQTYGLCDYQFRNTIKGKLNTKPNIHLKFQNQTPRKQYSTKIYYNNNLSFNFQGIQNKTYREILNKFHPFQSYTQRKVFETKDKLDKIYQIDIAKRKTFPTRMKKTVPFDTLPGRIQEEVKESSLLFYDTLYSERTIRKSAPKYSLIKSPRNFRIYKEVINPKRGCSR